MPSPAEVGAVVIGRNEGERLLRCLDAMLPQVERVVYVDSGSTDDSVAEAQKRGVEVVALDLQLPFTAARARNAGLERLRALDPSLRFVQFVDGDCELREGWIEAALTAFAADPALVVVCGRRRERYPEASPYNALCDVEWDGHAGYVDSSGGDALMKIDALAAVDGFVLESYFPTAGEVAAELDHTLALAAPLPTSAPLTVALTLWPAHHASRGDFLGKVETVLAAGVDRIALYNYGTATAESLSWTRDAANLLGGRA